MEESSSAANGPSESPAANVSGAWSRWWIRLLLFITHLTLLIAAASLTPSDKAFQLGYVVGGLIIVGSLFLWTFLWFVRQRTTILLFCGLALAQIVLIAFVSMQFRKEDRILQSIEADKAQLLKTWQTQMASYHADRIFEMLTPGNEFHPEELPGLLEHVHTATVTDSQYWAEMDAWANDGEKRLSAANPKAASDFRRGFESTRARNQRVQALNRDYLNGTEQLITLLIDLKSRYHSTKSGLMFDRRQDMDTFNQMIDSLNALRAKAQAEQRSDSAR